MFTDGKKTHIIVKPIQSLLCSETKKKKTLCKCFHERHVINDVNPGEEIYWKSPWICFGKTRRVKFYRNFVSGEIRGGAMFSNKTLHHSITLDL